MFYENVNNKKKKLSDIAIIAEWDTIKHYIVI